MAWVQPKRTALPELLSKLATLHGKLIELNAKKKVLRLRAQIGQEALQHKDKKR